MNFRSSLKVGSVLLLALLVAAIILVVALMYADPTKLKEQIEAEALKSGLELQLNGDLSWALFPDVQLRVEGAKLRSLESQSHLEAEVDQFNVALGAMPALRGELEFTGVEIAGAKISFGIAAHSRDDASHIYNQLETLSGFLPKTSIEGVRLSDIDLSIYGSGDNEPLQVQLHRLEAQNLGTSGVPFAVKSALDIAVLPEGFRHLEIDGFITIDALAEVYRADLSQLAVGGEGLGSNGSMEGFARLNLDRTRNHWSAELDLSESGRAGISASLAGEAYPLEAQGHLEANISDLGSWLALVTDQELSTPIKMFALDSDLSLAGKRIEISDARYRLDQSAGRGSGSYQWADEKKISADLAFQTLDINSYFPRESDAGADRRAAGVLVTSDQLTQLAALTLNARISASRLRAFDREFADLVVQANIDGGQARILVSETEFAGGVVAAEMSSDLAVSDDASLTITADGIQLDQASAKSELQAVLGTLSLDFNGTFADVTQPQILRGLEGDGQLQINGLEIASMNIERALCESAELVGASSAGTTDWPAGTALGDIDSEFSAQSGSLLFSGIQFGTGNMQATAEGSFNLLTSDYATDLEVRVDGEKTSEDGCRLNRYAQGVQLPLQCVGSLGADAQPSCGVDASVAERLVLQQVGGRLLENVLGRLEGDVSADPNAEADSGSDQSRRDELRAILEGMLRDIDN